MDSTSKTLSLLVLVALLLACVALIVAATVWWNRREKLHHSAHIRMKRHLLTANEHDFLGTLRSALPEFDIYAQVSQGALLEVSVPSTHPLYWPARSLFERKIADFVVCRRDDSAVLCLVELDDRTHDFAKDAVRDSVTGKAGLVTLRFWSRAKPTAAVVREAVLSVVS